MAASSGTEASNASGEVFQLSSACPTARAAREPAINPTQSGSGPSCRAKRTRSSSRAVRIPRAMLRVWSMEGRVYRGTWEKPCGVRQKTFPARKRVYWRTNKSFSPAIDSIAGPKDLLPG